MAIVAASLSIFWWAEIPAFRNAFVLRCVLMLAPDLRDVTCIRIQWARCKVNASGAILLSCRLSGPRHHRRRLTGQDIAGPGHPLALCRFRSLLPASLATSAQPVSACPSYLDEGSGIASR